MSEGELYPQTSQLLKLPKCLPKDCNEVGDEVIIETKLNTVKGLIHSIDGNGNLKLSYNAVDAGYPDCYQLEQCDVVSIRCYSCCDDRYFELESCEPLTCDIISAALGASSPKLVGNIFLYSGDLNEPDCLWKWNGLNDIGQPENWIDQYGDLAAQFSNLEHDPDQLCQFLTWLGAQFSGAGIAFNVSQYCDSIIVTVGDGSDTAPATFTYSYSGGRISLDANDGSGRKDANVIVRGAGPPTEPYNWFFYINTNTGGVFINNNGDAELFGIIDLEGSNSCADIIACVATNIEAGEPDPDRWAMPQVTTGGSTWIIESVVYKPGETTLSANFATCSSGATTLDELVDALNNCPNNPAGWVWVNSGGVLTLCTPVGDNVLTVTYDVGSGSQVINFNGVPTVAGEDRVDLISLIVNAITNRNMSIGTSFSDNDTEAEIESEFNSASSATVKWVDADGDDRISYKSPDGDWYHPAEKQISDEPYIFKVTRSTNGNTGHVSQQIDLTGHQVPSDAKSVDISIYFEGLDSLCYVDFFENLGNTTRPENHGYRAMFLNDNELPGLTSSIVTYRVPVSDPTEFTFYYFASATSTSTSKGEITMFVNGWKR